MRPATVQVSGPKRVGRPGRGGSIHGQPPPMKWTISIRSPSLRRRGGVERAGHDLEIALHRHLAWVEAEVGHQGCEGRSALRLACASPFTTSIMARVGRLERRRRQRLFAAPRCSLRPPVSRSISTFSATTIAGSGKPWRRGGRSGGAVWMGLPRSSTSKDHRGREAGVEKVVARAGERGGGSENADHSPRATGR